MRARFKSAACATKEAFLDLNYNAVDFVVDGFDFEEEQ